MSELYPLLDTVARFQTEVLVLVGGDQEGRAKTSQLVFRLRNHGFQVSILDPYLGTALIANALCRNSPEELAWRERVSCLLTARAERLRPNLVWMLGADSVTASCLEDLAEMGIPCLCWTENQVYVKAQPQVQCYLRDGHQVSRQDDEDFDGTVDHILFSVFKAFPWLFQERATSVSESLPLLMTEGAGKDPHLQRYLSLYDQEMTLVPVAP